MQERSLLVTDLDGTLLGDDEALIRFAEWMADNRDRLRLVYASGRFFESVCQSIETTALPAPDAVIGGVGTEVRCFPSGDSIPAALPPVSAEWDGEMIREHISDFPNLLPQPEDCQSRYKISFYLPDATANCLDKLRQRLNELPAHADIIYSSHRDLDVVPAGMNKGSTAERLAQTWGIPAESVLVSGDSGNDLSLFQQGFRGIVVANAHSVLLQLRGKAIYHASEPFAGGVLEGLNFWLTEQTTDEHLRRSVSTGH